MVYLPTDILFQIAEYTDLQTLGRMGSVDKEWNKVANHDALWRPRIPQHIPLPAVNIKKYIGARIISTQEEFVVKFQKFSATVPSHKHAQVTCLFLHHPAYSMKFALAVGNFAFDKVDIQEIVISKQRFAPRQNEDRTPIGSHSYYNGVSNPPVLANDCIQLPESINCYKINQICNDRISALSEKINPRLTTRIMTVFKKVIGWFK